MTDAKKKKERVMQRDEYETYYIGTCENCHKEKVKIRPIMAMGMFKEDRGWYQICFECFRPRVTWSDKRGVFISPTNIIVAPEGPEELPSPGGTQA